jgi:hypothetical protein
MTSKQILFVDDDPNVLEKPFDFARLLALLAE